MTSSVPTASAAAVEIGEVFRVRDHGRVAGWDTAHRGALLFAINSSAGSGTT